MCGRLVVIQVCQLAWYVPFAVVEYDDISSGQIDTESSRTSCEQEDKFFAARFVILVNPCGTIIVSGPAIYSACVNTC
jgi:hypothetical protein